MLIACIFDWEISTLSAKDTNELQLVTMFLHGLQACSTLVVETATLIEYSISSFSVLENIKLELLILHVLIFKLHFYYAMLLECKRVNLRCVPSQWLSSCSINLSL